MTTGRHAILVGLIGAIAASANLLAPISGYDGGLAGSAGTFMLHGAVPYRDFWWLYGPAAPVVVAIPTALLGPSLLLLRLLGLALVGILTGLTYAALRDRVPHGAAALISVGATSAVTHLVGLEISAWSLALVLALAGLNLRGREGGRHRALLAGILVGLAFAARLDVGGYALLAGLIAGDRRRFATGFVAIAAPLAGLALMTTPLSDLVEQLIWFPLIGTRQFRGLPLPEIINGAVVQAYVAFVAVLVIPKMAIAIAAIRIALGRDRSTLLLILTAFAALVQLQTIGRADFYHQAQAAVPGYLVLGLSGAGALARVRGRIPRREAYRRLAAFAGVASACALSLVLGAFSLLTAERGELSPDERGLVAGIRTLALNSTRDKPVFVGLTTNRITLLNDVLAYYLADRRAGVRVAMFNPGVTNTDRVQTEMAAQLATNGTELLLLNDVPALVMEPSNDSAILGSTILDDAIARDFVEVCRYGPIRILARRGVSPAVRCVEARMNERLIDVLGGLGLR